MSDLLRIGVIGTSRWTDAMFLTSLGSHPRANITAICGRNSDRAAEMAAKHAIPRVFSDYRQLVEADDVDAVVVATPDDLHYEMTLAALEARKHVLCEKPLALTAGHAQEMFTAAETRGLKHMVLFTWRWQPHFLFAKKLVEKGYVGRLNQADFYFLGGWALDRVYRWRADGRRTGGIVADLGSHMVDFVRWYVGEPAGVFALLDTFADLPVPADPDFVQANDAASLLLRMDNGAQVSIRVSSVAPQGSRDMEMGFRLFGENGTLEVGFIFGGPEAGAVVKGITGQETEFQTLEMPAELLEDLDLQNPFDVYTRRPAGPRLFVDAILDDQPIAPNFYDVWLVQRTIDAALLSHTEKRWVWLN